MLQTIFTQCQADLNTSNQLGIHSSSEEKIDLSVIITINPPLRSGLIFKFFEKFILSVAQIFTISILSVAIFFVKTHFNKQLNKPRN